MSKNQNNKIKVLCAMSGGVDSSVAAALLKKQGYEVLGVFLLFTRKPTNCSIKNHQHFGNTCCNDEALRSARAVCEKLKIPFYIFDVSREFKKEVVDYYISEYDNGRTPNPCVVCNKKIKFGWLIKKAIKLGCEYVATGHYARIARDLKSQNSKVKTITQNLKLFKAKDKKKDQSYFLWQLSQEELRHVMFPIGDYTKTKVREMARKWGLSTAQKPESQDICFVPESDNAKFLHQYAKKLTRSGNIADKYGNILGRHQGLINYTVGQRHGLPNLKYQNSNIKSNKNRPQPIYVLKLNIDKNELIVGGQLDLNLSILIAQNPNWINRPKRFSFSCLAKIRYGMKEAKCELRIVNNELRMTFKNPMRAITPGQSVVIYNNKELLGGGVIL